LSQRIDCSISSSSMTWTSTPRPIASSSVIGQLAAEMLLEVGEPGMTRRRFLLVAQVEARRPTA
jgi:hypothetical protein